MKSIDVVGSISFRESDDYLVSKISADRIRDAIVQISECADLVFVSCTNLKFLNVLKDIEAMIGKPIISSNQAIIKNYSISK